MTSPKLDRRSTTLYNEQQMQCAKESTVWSQGPHTHTWTYSPITIKKVKAYKVSGYSAGHSPTPTCKPQACRPQQTVPSGLDANGRTHKHLHKPVRPDEWNHNDGKCPGRIPLLSKHQVRQIFGLIWGRCWNTTPEANSWPVRNTALPHSCVVNSKFTREFTLTAWVTQCNDLCDKQHINLTYVYHFSPPHCSVMGRGGLNLVDSLGEVQGCPNTQLAASKLAGNRRHVLGFTLSWHDRKNGSKVTKNVPKPSIQYETKHLLAIIRKYKQCCKWRPLTCKQQTALTNPC